ncbi:MAG: hypothetical protein ACHQSE_03760 [Gemmatimonadales bacterium]
MSEACPQPGIASRRRNRDCYLPFALLLGGVILGSGSAVSLPTLKGLAQQYLAFLPHTADAVKRGLVFMATVPSEADGERLVGRLERMGYTELGLQRIRIMLRKRWRVVGLSCPVEYTVAEIHRWLDSIDGVAREYGATLETWVPTEQR